MQLRRLALAIVTTEVAINSPAAAGQLKFSTCVANARGQYYQFGPKQIVPDARRAIVGKTITYFPYEPPISLSNLKLGAPLTLVFTETAVEVEQGGEKYSDRIDFADSTWCQQNRLSGQRECFAFLAADPTLQSVLGGWNVEGVGPIHGFMGRWLDNDFCTASVVGVFRVVTSGSKPN